MTHVLEGFAAQNMCNDAVQLMRSGRCAAGGKMDDITVVAAILQ